MLHKHLPCTRLGYVLRMQSWVRSSFCPHNLKTYGKLRSENTLYKADFLWFLSLIQLLWVFREILSLSPGMVFRFGLYPPWHCLTVWSTWIIFFRPLVETASPLCPLKRRWQDAQCFRDGWPMVWCIVKLLLQFPSKQWPLDLQRFFGTMTLRPSSSSQQT